LARRGRQATVIKAGTLRRLRYLVDRGLADFSDSRFTIAATHYREAQPDGKVVTKRINDNSPTHASA
jgi:hypothetical protein